MTIYTRSPHVLARTLAEVFWQCGQLKYAAVTTLANQIIEFLFYFLRFAAQANQIAEILFEYLFYFHQIETQCKYK